jgi:hypothetical protein
MTLVVGLVLILLGVVVAVLQVRWAVRSTQRPLRRWHVSNSLPPRQRFVSDTAIAVLLFAGSLTIDVGRPWWVLYAVGVGAVAVTASAQALALRTLPEPAVR